MTTNISRGSAQIYKFPPRGCFAVGGRDEENTSAANFTSPHAAVACGAWYHDEAIQDADQTRKN